ncbi:hypothetical protein CVT25_011980 [Psilocybe cyanescens]|uniref:Uncharacterized protein n=1 Tax=Psilocybe cyanescens TaxID=93625 RepID=A0A409XLD9_PSICY|nr:hypothetical protein CVT25_011980 [Psilocybe cyanescens]
MPISSVNESATVDIITPNYSASDALYSSNSATGFSATDIASSSTQQQPAITALGQIQTSGGCRDTLTSWVDLSDSNPFPLDLYYSMSPPRLLSPMSDPGHSAPPSPGATPPPPQSGQPSAQPSPNINPSLIASHKGMPFQLTSNPSTIVSIETAHPHHHVVPAPQLSHSSAVQINDPLTVSNISASALVSGTPLSTTGANTALIEPSTTSITKQTPVAVKSTSNKGRK